MQTHDSRVQHTTDTFTATDGLALAEQSWSPAGEPVGVLAIVHGLADHGGRYSSLAKSLTMRGFAVCALDLRGHGRSAGTKQFVNSFEEHIRDVELFVDRLRQKYGDRPLFLMGHSMGGLIVTRYVLTRKPQLRGLILSGPALKAGADVSRFTKGLVKMMASVFPRLPTAKLDAHAISRDRSVVDANVNDTLVHRSPLPAKTSAEIIRAIDETQSAMGQLDLPVLILHGTADRLADVEGSKELYARAKSVDKTIHLYEGLFHEVVNEPEQDKVRADILTWLEARVAAPPRVSARA